jgi:hypothetical protein
MTEQSKSWRDQIKVHPAADLFPMMTPDELKALGEDIKKNGERVAVAVTRPGNGPWSLVDGRNRLDAAEAVGLSVKIGGYSPEPELLFVKVGDETRKADFTADPYGYALSANIHRRHLTAEQKRDLIAAVIKAQPGKSNRQIAKTVGVSHPHVATVRAELEKSGDVETVTTSIDTKGRKQPAKKKRRDVEDYIAEKKARLAATQDAGAPAPQQTDIEKCVTERDGTVQRDIRRCVSSFAMTTGSLRPLQGATPPTGGHVSALSTTTAAIALAQCRVSLTFTSMHARQSKRKQANDDHARSIGEHVRDPVSEPVCRQVSEHGWNPPQERIAAAGGQIRCSRAHPWKHCSLRPFSSAGGRNEQISRESRGPDKAAHRANAR